MSNRARLISEVRVLTDPENIINWNNQLQRTINSDEIINDVSRGVDYKSQCFFISIVVAGLVPEDRSPFFRVPSSGPPLVALTYLTASHSCVIFATNRGVIMSGGNASGAKRDSRVLFPERATSYSSGFSRRATRFHRAILEEARDLTQRDER